MKYRIFGTSFFFNPKNYIMEVHNYIDSIKKKQLFSKKMKELKANINLLDRENINNPHKKLSADILKTNYYSLSNQATKLYNDYSSIREEKKLFHDTIKSKNKTYTPELVSFLKQHNTIQNNSIKKFLKIPKNPMEVSSKDKEALFAALKTKYDAKILDTKKEIRNVLDQRNKFKEIIDLNKSIEIYKVLDKKNNLNNVQIEHFEKPIKKVIENIIDLNYKALKLNINKFPVSIDEILLYIKEVFSSKNKCIENSKINKNSLEVLSKKILNIQKEEVKNEKNLSLKV